MVPMLKADALLLASKFATRSGGGRLTDCTSRISSSGGLSALRKFAGPCMSAAELSILSLNAGVTNSMAAGFYRAPDSTFK